MKKFFMPLFLLGILFTSCSKDDVVEEVEEKKEEVEPVELTAEEKKDLEIKDFIWKSMNNIYLYKSHIPELADNYFSTQADLDEYLLKWDTPDDLFYSGLVADEDRFSWIVEDYEELESYLQGSSKSAGFRYGLVYAPNSTTKVLAYVIYVSPNGPAEAAGLKRADYISKVNGTDITVNNYQSIFNPDNLELGLSTIEDGFLVEVEDPINVTKSVFKENPIAVEKIFTVEGVKIGYLYLSSFLGEFGIDDVKLNETFGRFKSENIEELIVDLRYNGGGYSEFSSDLASMVTGQFNGEIFTQEVWNDDYQSYWQQNNPEYLYSRYNNEISNGEAINSLNLNRVHIIETGRSFSASESFLIGLEPYIEVIHVGTQTGGKFQGSITLYDSEGLTNKKNINPNHKYAIQPLIYKFANANGYTDFVDGLIPDIRIEEDINNLGQLGELDEPLLARTIEAITGVSSVSAAYQKKADEHALDFREIPMEDEKGFFISLDDPKNQLPFIFNKK
ncbi:S41 family peptidase [Salinimicrobium sp. HB62]|uniref:S41 family peptidase n=1 Tax=Salinimicrobium sp. HB62 TaxID=3077781 RepID=UPI002D780D43|nr:S41 family peptidase [Salinimicrobium sp. HB62]